MSTTTAPPAVPTAVLTPKQAAIVARKITERLEVDLERDDVKIARAEDLAEVIGEFQASAEVATDWLDQIAWGKPEHDVTLTMTPRDMLHLVARLFDEGGDQINWVDDERRDRDGLAALTPMREPAAIVATAVAILDQLEATR